MKSVKKILFLLILNFVIINLNAQTGLNFQGVARTSNNVILASQSITIRLTILRENSDGTKFEEYVETRKVTTNAQGLFTAVIGDTGTISKLGNFATINWKLSPKFLKIEMDPTAGSNFITMGTTQFQYVAYAQFANSVDAENIVGVVPVSRGGTGANSLSTFKTSLALNNVNNTADLSKPISSLTQTALDFKLNATDTSKYTKQKYTDSALLTKATQTALDFKLNAEDTSKYTKQKYTDSALITKLMIKDTLNLSNRINSKISPSDSVLFQNDIKINGHNIGRGSGNLINNIAFGDSALSFNKTGYSNLAIGVNALKYNRTGYRNTAIGDSAFISGTGFFNSTAIGYNAIVAGSNMIQLGDTNIFTVRTYGNIQSSRTISAATFTASTSSAFNGTSNLFKTLSSTNDITVNGILIGRGNGSKDYNLAIGKNTLINTSSERNIAIGDYALWKSTSAILNTALGIDALKNTTTGGANTSVGYGSMFGNTTGSQNSAFGLGALSQNTIGIENVGVGWQSITQNTSGINNTAIGSNSMYGNTTGNNNTALGKNSLLNTNFNNTTGVGYNAQVSSDNQIQLGDENVTDVKTYGKVTATGFKTPNGTSEQYLKADGSSDITVIVDAGTLTGTTLKSTVTSSNLTSVGTIASLTTGAITNSGKVIVGASSAASPSAVLEASSTTQGFLPPRLNYYQKTQISSPVAGLTIWCSNCGASGEMQVFNGAAWTNMTGGTATGPISLNIGDSYQGGKVAYILVSGDPGYDANTPHGLIAATSDQSAGISWYNNNDPQGATLTAIGTGLANTISIIASARTELTAYAAGLARVHTGGGYTDWYLPSKDELNKLYSNRTSIGGFENLNYWSSSGVPYYDAWVQNFGNGGGQSYNRDSNTYRVRAVRAF